MTDKNQYEPLIDTLRRLKQEAGNRKPVQTTAVVIDADTDTAKNEEWLHDVYGKRMKHLREQEDYLIAIISEFEKGNREEARSLFKAHPKPDELFLFFLDYMDDPKAKASRTAELRHAPLEPYRKRARKMYSALKEIRTRITQETFAEAFSKLMQEEFDANELEMKQLEEEIASEKIKIQNSINRQSKARLIEKLENMKGMLELMKLHPKTPTTKAIASWLLGL